MMVSCVSDKLRKLQKSISGYYENLLYTRTYTESFANIISRDLLQYAGVSPVILITNTQV